MARVREASPEDAAAIIRFQHEMATETEGIVLDEETVEAGVQAVFDDSSRGRYFVAESDEGRVIGSLLVTREWSDWRNGWIWWIQSVFVEPAFRGRGVYRGLYEEITRRATTERDVVGVRLYVDRRNLRAQEVYRRLGMDGDHYIVFEAMDS